MNIVDDKSCDILLDAGYQMDVISGECVSVSDDGLMLQDIMQEAVTEEGELWYEDREGEDAYGWGLLDFVNVEKDELFETEIKQRIKEKLGKREYIDSGSIEVSIEELENGMTKLGIIFSKTDDTKTYNLDIAISEAEVEIL